jgi:hypothetical protein
MAPPRHLPSRLSTLFFLLASVVAIEGFAACGDAGGTAPGADPAAGGAGGADAGAGGESGEGGSEVGGEGGSEAGGAAAGGADPGGSGGSIQVGGQGQGGSSITPAACKSSCGPEELCDPDHLGYDDDCDGQVDEGCGCVPGQSHWCFKGDPANRFAGACQDGVERCSEVGFWGSCEGGKHALDGPDNCLNANKECVDLKAGPFAKVKLAQGTAKFSENADPGSESYTVTCPPGTPNCPGVTNGKTKAATFQPLQSGEYGVTYTKTTGGVSKSCNYALFVGAEGLRVELTWDNLGIDGAEGAAKGPDLDLHVHRPDSTTPWGFQNGSSDDCYHGNCRIEHFSGNEPPFGNKAVDWFFDGGQGAQNWSKDAGCYSVPISGGQWSALGKGCHNPRLDTDTFSCDAKIVDPNNPEFCAPENINLDDVPDSGWFRVGVHYNALCAPKDTHPVLTVYCDGGQVARIGSDKVNNQLVPSGYSEPVTFQPTDCGKKFWVAADVRVKKTECSLQCTVIPILSNAATKAPYFLTPAAAEASFGPPYPPVPLAKLPVPSAMCFTGGGPMELDRARLKKAQPPSSNGCRARGKPPATPDPMAFFSYGHSGGFCS